MTLVQTEPKKIYYGEPIIISDMQGPCPDGFHVPTKDEWVALYNVGVSLGAWTSSGGNNIKTYLKLPMAGYRSSYNAEMDAVGTSAYYWSSSYYDTDNVYSFNIQSSGAIVYPQYTYYRACGCSIRGFKNTTVEPTSSRTKLYGTSIESGGIFWSSTDGLISLSSNGQTWITIADKNVGATTVYNSGDTLSEANCGKQYQRGNNYGFPVTGTVTTSLNMVNAADYGPGNYYSSSTFIKRTSSPWGQWDSSSNNNLRGGVSQGTSEEATEIKAVYLGETKVRPSLPDYTMIDFLLVGGGGAGSGYFGGGGGAGGVIQCCEYCIDPGSYAVTVGARGCGWTYCCGNNGGNSTFNGLTAYGGGGGGGCGSKGRNGGSGGGAGYPNRGSTCGGCGCSGQGYAGGNGYNFAGGGGGGACGKGGDYQTPCLGGKGGVGLQSDISGTMTWYAGGGSGLDGYNATSVSASNGGTASGCGGTSNATYCGAGGGGTYCNCGNGRGGCGVFIVRYPTAYCYNITGGCKYTCGDYTIHCFTSNGTLTVN